MLKKINVTGLCQKAIISGQKIKFYKKMNDLLKKEREAEFVETICTLEEDGKTVLLIDRFDSGEDSYEITNTFELKDNESFAGYFTELLEYTLKEKRNIKYALLNPGFTKRTYFEIVAEKIQG